jgi:hypothetical protein
MSISILSSLDFGGTSRIANLPPAIAPGQPATYEQLGTAPIETVTLDFGSTPVASKLFTFTRSGAIVSQNVLMSVSAKMPAGVDLDELEMDSIGVSAYLTLPPLGLVSLSLTQT